MKSTIVEGHLASVYSQTSIIDYRVQITQGSRAVRNKTLAEASHGLSAIAKLLVRITASWRLHAYPDRHGICLPIIRSRDIHVVTHTEIGDADFLPRDPTQSAILLRQVVCPSACPSVTLKYRDHIGWKSSKIILPLVSLGYSLAADHNITDIL